MHISIIGAGKMGKDISALLSQSVYIDKINLISLNSDFKKKQSEFKDYIKDLEIKLEKKYEIKNFNKIYLTNDIQVIKTSEFIIESVIEDYSIKLKIIKKLIVMLVMKLYFLLIHHHLILKNFKIIINIKKFLWYAFF